MTLCVVILSGCGDHEGTRQVQAQRSLATAPAGTRLLVLRLGEDRITVLRNRVLDRSTRPARRAPPGWRGRWELLDPQGRVLRRGAFRLPRRVHALFGDQGGQAGPGDAPLRRPVVWLRVPRLPAAVRLRLRDARLARAIGEVVL